MLCSMLYPSVPHHDVLHRMAMQEAYERRLYQQQREREAAAYQRACEEEALMEAISLLRRRQQLQQQQQRQQQQRERQRQLLQREALFRIEQERQLAIEAQQQRRQALRAYAAQHHHHQQQQQHARSQPPYIVERSLSDEAIQRQRQRDEEIAEARARAVAEAKERKQRLEDEEKARREAAARTIQRQFRAHQACRLTRASLPALAAIKTVRDEVAPLFAKMHGEMHAVFDQDRQKAIIPFVDGANKDLLSVEEQLLKALIRLDAIEVLGGLHDLVRSHRKALVRRIDEALSSIEEKKQAAFQRLETPAQTPEPPTSGAQTPEPLSPTHSTDDILANRDIDLALVKEEAIMHKAMRGLKQRRRFAKARKSNKICRFV